MRKFLSIVGLILFSAVLAAQQPIKLTETVAIRTSFDSEKITIDATSGGVGFTASKINPTCTDCIPAISQASAAQCTLETGDIRVSVSSTAPTSSTGMYLAAGTTFIVYGYADISTFKGIRVTTTSGVLNCTYFR